MSSEISKLKMKTANARPQKMPITTQCIGTTDFFKPTIVSFQEVVPGEHVNLDTIMSIQGKPMAMPAEVQLKHNLRAFYVPQRVISKNWLKFITEKPYKDEDDAMAVHTKDTIISNFYFVIMFLSEEFQLIRNIKKTQGMNEEYYNSHDLCCTFNDSHEVEVYVYFDLTNKGRRLYDILLGCGYNINWYLPGNGADWGWEYDTNGTLTLVDSGNDWGGTVEGFLEKITKEQGLENMSFKPFYAYMKIFADFYQPSQYEEYYNEIVEDIKDAEYIYDLQIFDRFIDYILNVAYEIDYFTGAWKTPTGPNEKIQTNIEIKDISMQNASYKSTAAVTGDTNTPKIGRRLEDGTWGATPANITKYILNALDAVQNYVTRNRIAGYRPVDRFLAQYGIHLNYLQTGRCQYLGGNTVSLNISTVVSQSETGDSAGQTGQTDQQLLGGKAAIVSGMNRLNTKWKCDEFGYIVVIQTIIPRIGYYQGIKPWVARIDKMQFYNATFDNLGVETIPKKYLMHSYQGTDPVKVQNEWERIWGYSGTFMDYKVGFDTLMGDYRLKTLNQGIESMHSFRIIKESNVENIGEELPQSIQWSFLNGEQAQYDRLFAYTNDDVDHFYFSTLNRNTGTKPMKSASETLDITDGEGNYTEFEVGGSYMN